jgi:hypothetical protein
VHGHLIISQKVRKSKGQKVDMLREAFYPEALYNRLCFGENCPPKHKKRFLTF